MNLCLAILFNRSFYTLNYLTFYQAKTPTDHVFMQFKFYFHLTKWLYLSVWVVCFLKWLFPLTPLYYSFRLICKCGIHNLSHGPISAKHNQLYSIILQWEHSLLPRDYPPFILNYPPPNSPHALGGLLKFGGLKFFFFLNKRFINVLM